MPSVYMHSDIEFDASRYGDIKRKLFEWTKLTLLLIVQHSTVLYKESLVNRGDFKIMHKMTKSEDEEHQIRIHR